MNIGIVSDPLSHPDWLKMEAFLKPSAEYGEIDLIAEPHLALWAVYDGSELVGVATAKLTSEGWGEVPLIGGVCTGKWIPELDRVMGEAMKAHGMTAVRGRGRLGWKRMLVACGWRMTGKTGRFTEYERAL